MDLALFARSLFVGLAIAAPVGPVGILCIRRTLRDDWATGVATGLGAATADAAYGAVAAFGLTFVIGWIGAWDLALRLAGGVALAIIGVRILRTDVATAPRETSRRALVGAYGTTVILTVTNPATIISFVGIVASLGIQDDSIASASIVVAGVATGSAAWWLALTSVIAVFRTRISPAGLRWVNRVAGGLLILFGIAVAVSTVAGQR